MGLPAAMRSGGEFLLADGSRVLDDVAPEALAEMRRRQLRVRVATLQLPFVSRAGPFRAALEQAIALVVSAALAVRTPLDLEVCWGGDPSSPSLRIFERPKPPVNRHPRTGRLSWFSSIHSQSAYLQRRRPCPVEGVAATDVLYGDYGEVEPRVLDHIEEVVSSHTARLRMGRGDVVLLDSYRALHGRDVFEGTRRHAVAWLTDDGRSPPARSGIGG